MGVITELYLRLLSSINSDKLRQLLSSIANKLEAIEAHGGRRTDRPSITEEKTPVVFWRTDKLNGIMKFIILFLPRSRIGLIQDNFVYDRIRLSPETLSISGHEVFSTTHSHSSLHLFDCVSRRGIILGQLPTIFTKN